MSRTVIDATRPRTGNASALAVTALSRVVFMQGQDNGTVVQTVGGFTQAVAGGVNFSGILIQHLGGVRQAGTGALTFSGSASQRVGGFRSSTSGAFTLTGLVTQRVGSLTQSASGRTTFSGAIIARVRGLIQTGTGLVKFVGNASQRVGGLRSNASGSFALTGTAAQHIGALRQAAVGGLTFTGAIAQAFGKFRGLPVYEGAALSILGGFGQALTGEMRPGKPFVQIPSDLYVDQGNQGSQHDGSAVAPFLKITDAIAYANLAQNKAFSIFVAPGNYQDETLTFDQHVVWTLEGPVSGAVLLGPVVWRATGGANPVPDSALVLRQVAAMSLTVEDGDAPATNAVLVLENAAIFTDIVSTGTSLVKTLISGISTAAIAIAGNQVSSLILGNIYLPNCPIGLTNTQVLGNITGQTIWTQGSQCDGWLRCAGTSVDLQFTDLSSHPSVTFLGSPGVLILGAETSTKWWSSGGVLTNGTIQYTTPVVLKFPASFSIPALAKGESAFLQAAVNGIDLGDSVMVQIDELGLLQDAGRVTAQGQVSCQVFALSDYPSGTANASVTCVKS